MSEKKLVPEGAFLVCDKGTLPSQITSSSMEEVSIYGQTVITEADKVFMVNFQPFGPCVCLHGQPCMAQPLMWDSLADGITIGQFAPVLEDAKLPCALGGQISIFPTPAVAFAKVPKSAKKEKDFWDKTLDFGLGVGEGLWTGAKGTVIGVCDLAVWTAKHMPPYVLLNPSGYAEQLQKDAAAVKALGGLAADAGTWVYRNSAVNMLANPEDYAAAQQESKQAMGALAEKMNNMDARDWGNFTGQVGFEIGLNMATGGGAGIATGMKAADLTGDAMRAAQKLDKALEATRTVDKASDATRAVDKLEDVADADKAVDKAEHASDAARAGKVAEEGEDASDAANKAEDVADAAGPEPLGDVVYDSGIRPSDLGISMLADNPELLKLWNDLLRKKASSPFDNEYKRYLTKLEAGEAMDSEYLGKVYGQIRNDFGKELKKKGHDIEGMELHHWNYPKDQFPEQITNPRNLTEPINRDAHERIHDAVHNPEAPGKNKWDKRIKPENEIEVNSSKID